MNRLVANSKHSPRVTTAHLAPHMTHRDLELESDLHIVAIAWNQQPIELSSEHAKYQKYIKSVDMAFSQNTVHFLLTLLDTTRDYSLT